MHIHYGMEGRNQWERGGGVNRKCLLVLFHNKDNQNKKLKCAREKSGSFALSPQRNIPPRSLSCIYCYQYKVVFWKNGAKEHTLTLPSQQNLVFCSQFAISLVNICQFWWSLSFFFQVWPTLKKLYRKFMYYKNYPEIHESWDIFWLPKFDFDYNKNSQIFKIQIIKLILKHVTPKFVV